MIENKGIGEEEKPETSTKVWVYHAEHEAKIIERDEVQSYYNDGWVDHPDRVGTKMSVAPVTKTESCPTCGQNREVEVSVVIHDDLVNKEAPAVEEKPPVVDEVADGKPTKGKAADPLDDMTKAQLLEEADKFGITPDSQAKKADIIRIIRSCQGEAPKQKAS